MTFSTGTGQVYVPIALPLNEAQAAFNACRATFQQLTEMGIAADHPALARAMYKIAKAMDKATGQEYED
jgi:hypothetical protein